MGVLALGVVAGVVGVVGAVMAVLEPAPAVEAARAEPPPPAAAPRPAVVAAPPDDKREAPAAPNTRYQVYDDDPRFGLLDTSSQAKTGLEDGIAYADNHMRELPVGVRRFEGVPFRVRDRYMLFDPETRFDDIGVGGPVRRLHVLHGGHYYGADDQLLAHFVLRYEDGTSAGLPVRYRRDVVNYWCSDGVPTHARVAWRGGNPAAAAQGCRLAIYLSTYDNPHPDRAVRAVDYVRAAGAQGRGQANTFCVALTVERD